MANKYAFFMKNSDGEIQSFELAALDSVKSDVNDLQASVGVSVNEAVVSVALPYTHDTAISLATSGITYKVGAHQLQVSYDGISIPYDRITESGTPGTEESEFSLTFDIMPDTTDPNYDPSNPGSVEVFVRVLKDGQAGAANIGSASNLQTDVKTNLVAAINDLSSKLAALTARVTALEA